MTIPLMILSDAPTANTGLARITRDLATRIAEDMKDEFTIATLGYGGEYSRKLPFHQYQMAMDNWVVHNLPEVWQDFAQGQHGILMTIWDASRLLWLSRPENCTDQRVGRFLASKPFETWGYFPMDATGPADKLPMILKHTIEGFDRALAYTKWAEDVLRRTLWKKPMLTELTNLPHGLDTSVFYPRPMSEARLGFGRRINAKNQKGEYLSIPDNNLVIGIVATNQIRKDFGLAAQILHKLKQSNKGLTIWIHTDEMERHWSLPILLNEYGIDRNAIVTIAELSDEQMAWCYSACDLTLGIGAGEGLGFPIFESLACGIPCFHGNYGGAPEYMPDHLKVNPLIYRIEGVYACMRPVFDPADWISAMARPQADVSLPSELDWSNLWPRWRTWLKKGIHGKEEALREDEQQQLTEGRSETAEV